MHERRMCLREGNPNKGYDCMWGLRIYNFQLNIIKVIKSRTIRYAGHIQIYRIWRVKNTYIHTYLKGGDNLREVGIGGSIIIKLVLNKRAVNVRVDSSGSR
jgi:hypothetical protein